MSSWGYTKENGPHVWSKYAPIANGQRQSPINIEPSKCVFDNNLRTNPLTYKYDPSKATSLVNTGLSAQVKYDSAGSTLSGGPLANNYRIAQFHLHWGKTSQTGSEHRINDKMFASELHIVHWNCDKYTSFAEAADKPDGLCVLGVFLQVGGAEHRGLKGMTDLLGKVSCCNDEVDVAAFDPISVLPDDQTSYWTYLGSLTTPPLYESVTWIVFKDPITVSEQQMNAFRVMNQNAKGQPAVKDEYDGKICENYRPPQPLCGRVVRASFK